MWAKTIQWRGSTIRLVSTGEPLDVDRAIEELEIGRARAMEDLGGIEPPPLGTAQDPYIILATPKPDCPGGALACSTQAPYTRSKWTLVRTTLGKKVLNAIDHEAQHRWCVLLTGDTKKCMFADHPIDKETRYNVLGVPVSVKKKERPPPTEQPPIPSVPPPKKKRKKRRNKRSK